MRPPAPAESVARFMILSRNNLQESLGFAVATMDDGRSISNSNITPPFYLTWVVSYVLYGVKYIDLVSLDAAWPVNLKF